MLNFLSMIIVLWLHRIISLFIGIMSKVSRKELSYFQTYLQLTWKRFSQKKIICIM